MEEVKKYVIIFDLDGTLADIPTIKVSNRGEF